MEIPDFSEEGTTIESVLPYGEVIGHVVLFVLIPIPLALLSPFVAVAGLFGLAVIAAFISDRARDSILGAVAAGAVWAVLLFLFANALTLGAAGASGPLISAGLLLIVLLVGVGIGLAVRQITSPAELEAIAERMEE